jgi:tRNA1(Val) A37 N6-methylase TrmN6
MDIHKTIARHEIETNLDKIVKISAYLLKNGGYLAMVHQTNRFFDVVDVLKKHNFSINKVQFIYPKEDKESNLFMIEAIKDGNSGVKFLKPLYVHNNDGTYKDEIIKMFKNKKEVNS